MSTHEQSESRVCLTVASKFSIFMLQRARKISLTYYTSENKQNNALMVQIKTTSVKNKMRSSACESVEFCEGSAERDSVLAVTSRAPRPLATQHLPR